MKLDGNTTKTVKSMQAAFFDLDGTLIDSRKDLAASVNLTRRDFGLSPLPLERVVACVGEGVRRLLTLTIPERPSEIDEAMKRMRIHYHAHLLDATTLYPGVREALDMLGDQGWLRAVVTNKNREYVEPILAGLGVKECFGAFVGGGEIPELKPDPAPVILAGRRLGLTDLRGCWMVGDHFTDLEAGRRLEMQRCFCRFGLGNPRGETYDLAVDSLVEFAQHVGRAK